MLKKTVKTSKQGAPTIKHRICPVCSKAYLPTKAYYRACSFECQEKLNAADYCELERLTASYRGEPF